MVRKQAAAGGEPRRQIGEVAFSEVLPARCTQRTRNRLPPGVQQRNPRPAMQRLASANRARGKHSHAQAKLRIIGRSRINKTVKSICSHTRVSDLTDPPGWDTSAHVRGVAILENTK